MASDEASLKRHIEHAQLPVLHPDQQAKIAAASSVAAGKKVEQGGKDILDDADQNVDLDTYRRLRHQFGSNIKSFGDPLLKEGSSASLASGSGSSSTLTPEASGTKGPISTALAEKLVPVSSFLGSTVGTATGVTSSPNGSLNELPNMLGHLMDRTNSGIRSKFESGLLQYKTDKLPEMPKSLNGSAEQFAHSLKSQMGFPGRYLTDPYCGNLKSITQLTKLSETLFGLVQKFGENIIDTKFPGVMDYLKTILNTVSKLPNVTSKFGVGTTMPGALKQVGTLSTTLNGFAKNPIGSAGQYFKIQSVNKNLHVIQDPSSLLKKQFPPQFTAWTGKLGSMSGFGRGGNVGFNFGQKLAELQPGALNNITKTFGSQQAILGPILNRAMHDVPSFGYNTQASTLKDGTSYQLNPAGEKVLEKPRTSVVQSKSYEPEEKPINYFTQNKLDKDSAAATTSLTESTNPPAVSPPTLSLGNNTPIKLFGD